MPLLETIDGREHQAIKHVRRPFQSLCEIALVPVCREPARPGPLGLLQVGIEGLCGFQPLLLIIAMVTGEAAILAFLLLAVPLGVVIYFMMPPVKAASV